ncbi:MAG: hypothetical protein LC808_07530 [Actinobacteria bacterium]|nr:hypothetical protein [Actinomycetota bacterium]
MSNVLEYLDQHVDPQPAEEPEWLVEPTVDQDDIDHWSMLDALWDYWDAPLGGDSG